MQVQSVLDAKTMEGKYFLICRVIRFGTSRAVNRTSSHRLCFKGL